MRRLRTMGVLVSAVGLGTLGVALTPAPAFAQASITSVVVTGTQANPLLTVTGSGFGTAAPSPSYPAGPCPSRGTGSLYESGLDFHDYTNSWDAGQGGVDGLGDCVGIVVVNWSDSQVQFGFGSDYGGSGWIVDPSDIFSVTLEGTTFVSGARSTSSVKCSKLSGPYNNFKLSRCLPKSVSNVSAKGSATSILWSHSGQSSTLSLIGVVSTSGTCPVGDSQYSYTGYVIGGNSTYAVVGDPVVADVCVTSTNRVTLAASTKFHL
jgi:hypothetical protein